MRPLPRNPYAFQARIISALIDDLSDTQARGYPRLEAIRSIPKEKRNGTDARPPA